jgi:predicted oxidoreductase
VLPATRIAAEFTSLENEGKAKGLAISNQQSAILLMKAGETPALPAGATFR